MKANYKIEAGDVRVIRPLCYARETLTKDFARTNRLPLVNENCPACFEEPKERHRVKKVGGGGVCRCIICGVPTAWEATPCCVLRIHQPPAGGPTQNSVVLEFRYL